MPRSRCLTELPALGALDRAAGSVGRQLALALRQAIQRGELKAGERIPSTRTLARSLGLARSTVADVFDQLAAEGYLDARSGSGTWVSSAFGLMAPVSMTASSAAPPAPVSLPSSAQRYAAIARALSPLPAVPFSVAVPEGEAAPDDRWRCLGNRVRAGQAAALAGYSDPRGLFSLRAAIATYLRQSRAAIAEPDNIILTEGTQQGLYLAARVLLSPGDGAWAEDPAYAGLIAVLTECGVQTRRIPVDTQGMDVELATRRYADARAAFVTPSHQYPLGMPLSMGRRLALLEWARQHDSWIVEDDYDSELRYVGHPFPAMQGLDPGRVVYLGTFSKVMAPSLRLGYMVVPAALTEAFAGARALMGRASPLADQHVLTAYMQEGYFEAHIRRIRTVYAERRHVLIEALQHETPWLQLEPGDQGMHLVAWLPDGVEDVAVERAAHAAGLALRALSPMYAGPTRRSGLMLGFGGFPPEALRQAVRQLRTVLTPFMTLL
ncbi:PLP-dependent aminotransferase family protein [Dickeya dadantii]|uniref:MocR-like pyridoxine biosynthesis transcription factor PdxR n=1 Tax=Dickeya dadantii TaxID=204038 RepID=UPI0003A0EA74|nr:PLP-dependent aminotransferase family protein [Dickeya dadantii]